MKRLLIASFIFFTGFAANAQITKVTLQASGLTCSMCSKAVLKALQGVPFVDKVLVNIKTQEYSISFKEDTTPDIDALSKAVEDAGFSVAKLQVTANMEKTTLSPDAHLQIGQLNFHFLNGTGQEVGGPATFMLVDKNFTSAKEYKKYSGLSKKECVQTGKMAKCCSKDEVAEAVRIYHAII